LYVYIEHTHANHLAHTDIQAGHAQSYWVKDRHWKVIEHSMPLLEKRIGKITGEHEEIYGLKVLRVYGLRLVGGWAIDGGDQQEIL